MRDFKTLDVWKMAMEINKEIYEISKRFPSEEKYGMFSQTRRSSISIALNIAEGCGRKTEKEFITFLYNAMGSLKELECQMFIAKDLGYVDNGVFEKMSGELDLLGKKFISFIKYIEQKNGVKKNE